MGASLLCPADSDILPGSRAVRAQRSPGWSSCGAPASHSFYGGGESCEGQNRQGQARCSLGAEKIWAGHRGGGRAERPHCEAARQYLSSVSPCPLDTHPGRPHRQDLRKHSQLGAQHPERESCPFPASCRHLIPITCLTLPRPATNCSTLASVALGSAWPSGGEHWPGIHCSLRYKAQFVYFPAM